MFNSRLAVLRQQHSTNRNAAQRIQTLISSTCWSNKSTALRKPVLRNLSFISANRTAPKINALYSQAHCITVQPLLSRTEPSHKTSSSSAKQNQDRLFQLQDLAAEVASVLANENIPALSTWAARIRLISAGKLIDHKRTGVIYLDSNQQQASMVGSAGLAYLKDVDLLKRIIDSVQNSLTKSSGPVSVELAKGVTISSAKSPPVALELCDTDTTNKDTTYAAADGCSISFVSVTAAAELDYNSFVDWMFSCSRLVIVAKRADLLKDLVNTAPFLCALQMHPEIAILVAGLGENKDSICSFEYLLQEALVMVGASGKVRSHLHRSVVPIANTDPDSLHKYASKLLAVEKKGAETNSESFLVCALDAALSCAECGGKSNFMETYPSWASFQAHSMDTSRHIFSCESNQSRATLVESAGTIDALLSTSESSVDKVALSQLSNKIQNEFDSSSDLNAINDSVGAIKQRIKRWLAGGMIWKAMQMKVEEIADILTEDVVLDRSFEEAELAMIHASGRLNEAIKYAANEFASAMNILYMDSVSEKAGAAASIDPSTFASAKNSLRALALQKEPVSQFAFACHVWETRKALAESNVLTTIPAYIRTSLAGFWTINASAIAAGAVGIAWLNIPVLYAGFGSSAIAIVACLWLQSRWKKLGSKLYKHLDDQSAELSRKILAAHRAELQSKLDRPIIECIGSTAGLEQLATDASRYKKQSISSSNNNNGLAASVAVWRTRLRQALS